MEKNEKFVIIDGNNICFRSFYALPLLQNFEGVVSNAVFGFANTLVKIIEEYNPKYIAVAFDKGKNTFRHKMYKEYKAQRKPTPKELLSQLPLLKEMLTTMNIKYIELDDIEADDIIGILSRKFDVENVIVSADKDVLQLINGNTKVYSPQKGSDAVIYDKEKLKEVMGIEPYQIIELKALMGDSSDNIPGIEGIGEKTALGLITKYTTLDGVYEHLSELTPKQREKLERDKERAYFSKKLATINLEYNLVENLQDFEYDYPFTKDTYEFFKKYQFNSLLRKNQIFNVLQENDSSIDDELKTISDELEVKEALNKIAKAKELFIFIDDKFASFYDGEDEFNFRIEPSLIDEYVSLDYILNEIRIALESEDINLYLYDSKAFMHDMSNYDIDIKNVTFDCMVAKYLVNSNVKPIGFISAIDYFGLSKGFLSKNIYFMTQTLQEKLKVLDLSSLYYDVELPLVSVLFDMEKSGIKIDENELDSLDKKYDNICKELTNEIYGYAGYQFNINSPKQLAEVLFGKLGLVSKQNKKDSTNISILNELIGQHPIVKKIIEYRQIYKLQSTYIKLYQEYIDKEGFVHTIFNQALTATGRLSSIEPNLQNIPTKSNEAKILRKIFIPRTQDGCLISADYSQIELRLLANFSNDEKLIAAYNEGVDIHTLTASEIFGVAISMVTDEMRRNAKAINFGIIYGISDWGLSQNIGIGKTEASKYIKKYFEKYPSIESYINGNVEFAKENGFVRTLMNRIRFIPELKGNKMQQLFGERVAMNMPLQGTAADIIKMAMVKVYKELKKRNLQSKLILQIHDELIIDTVKGEEAVVEKILQECMENVVNLKVKLTINIGRGQNLSEAK